MFKIERFKAFFSRFNNGRYASITELFLKYMSSPLLSLILCCKVTFLEGLVIS
jgi:hypothetical protein